MNFLQCFMIIAAALAVITTRETSLFASATTSIAAVARTRGIRNRRLADGEEQQIPPPPPPQQEHEHEQEHEEQVQQEEQPIPQQQEQQIPQQQQQQVSTPVTYQPPPQPASNARINLVQLIPFDVTIALTRNEGINIFEVTDIITQWINESFQRQVSQSPWMVGYSAFDSVILDERRSAFSATPPTAVSSTPNNNNNVGASANGGGTRRLKKVEYHPSHRELPERFVASYDGVSLWRHEDLLSEVTTEMVERMERQTLQEDAILLQMLQTSYATGLGSAVIDVRAFINPRVNIPADANIYTINSQGNINDGGNSDDLELIIVVAIVVACIAFAFLVFALFYAWRFDKQRRDSYHVRSPNQKGGNQSTSNSIPNSRSPTGTGGTASDHGSPEQVDVQHHQYHTNGPMKIHDDAKSLPSEVSPHDLNASGYPESVISEDISTSLTAYYKSGMGGNNYPYSNNNNGALNDGASFSSMESYGYSLDGYAPSINTYRNSAINTTTNTTTTINNSKEKTTNNQDDTVESNSNDKKESTSNDSPHEQTDPETEAETVSDQSSPPKTSGRR